MSSRRLLQQAFGLTSIVLLLAGCGGALAEPTATPPTTGTITGKVLDHYGKPLGNIHEEETMIAALLCRSNDSDIECLHENFWDMEMEVVIDSICETDDSAENCLLHWGRSAASVEADGSYTLADVPPGQYGVVFMFKNPAEISMSLSVDVILVQVGEISEYDIETDLQRK